MVVTEGLPARAVQTPVPVAAILTVENWQVVWSGPASGLGVTVTNILSLHPFTVHMSVYTPEDMKPETVVVGEVAFVKVTITGFPGSAVHVPFPVAAMTVVLYWQMV